MSCQDSNCVTAIAEKVDAPDQPLPAVARRNGWLLLTPIPTVVVLLLAPAELPAWERMWLLAVAIYLGCKWLTWMDCSVRSTFSRNVAYWLLWPGLDAAAFLTLDSPATIAAPTVGEWILAAVKTILGAVLFGTAIRLADLPAALAVGWLGMLGMILLLHFGLFHLLSCWWRSRGVNAVPLMNFPSAARSVSDFWGRRWNSAFRDLTHRFLFRPLAGRIGPVWAVMCGFLFSGLVHDFVISYPAGGGYGWPTAYFLLQGSAIVLERSSLGKQGSLHRGWRGRTLAAVVLVAPIAWLFHHWFVENVVVPMLLALKEVG
ncbi:wax synthase family protein [Blastopirellula marina]|uniref:Wax synthase domain-containing protein n=1 Tax=Blastopirellula marina TaxID=124 RepID=A0A2S8GAL4_9BACT|nr:membrane bound O-acyl transferase family-domain-containing protein [Blastopirellula marina]PQO41498.1 hypothetical protein C5Y93_30790 [Blastopirellula marina]